MVFTTGGAKLGGPSQKSGPPNFFLAPPTFKVGGAKSHENFVCTFFRKYGPQWLQNFQNVFGEDFYTCRTPKHHKTLYATHICPDFYNFSRKLCFLKIFDPKIAYFQPKMSFVKTIACSCSLRAHTYTSLTFCFRAWTAQVAYTMIPKIWREHMSSFTLQKPIIYPQRNVSLAAHILRGEISSYVLPRYGCRKHLFMFDSFVLFLQIIAFTPGRL